MAGGFGDMKASKPTVLKAKYLNLLVGSVFAILAIIFLVWELQELFINRSGFFMCILPLLGMAFSVLFGLFIMFLKS